MKNAEKMFMAINNVDERLINEAKGRDEKPVLIQVEKHLPVREIIGFAACFAVLVTGIFMLLKFRINPDPINSGVGTISDNSSENSSFESDTSSTDSTVSDQDNSENSKTSAVTPDISEEDAELREILRGLAANAADLSGLFTEDHRDGKDEISYPLVDFNGAYYPIADGDRTLPNGLFAMPKTRSELEAMLLTTFTERAVESYMQYVGTGIFVTDTDGSTGIFATDTDGSPVINETNDYGGHKKFLEIDGRLYHDTSDSIFKWYCSPDSAQVISKTDKTIRFRFYGLGSWDDKTGTIVYENGGWKLDYFYIEGFIPELPTEFTDDDKELNDILNGLTAAMTLRSHFYDGAYSKHVYTFKKSNDPDSYEFRYSLLPGGETDPYSGLVYPKTREQYKELLLRFFTQEVTDQYMSGIGKGTMTENPDGTYTVISDDPSNGQIPDNILPTLLEIDGQMYVMEILKGGPPVPVWGTAQVTEKTADSIKFTIIYEQLSGYFPGKGSIKYERGEWKLDYDLRYEE